jgi:hypothetical protein
MTGVLHSGTETSVVRRGGLLPFSIQRTPWLTSLLFRGFVWRNFGECWLVSGAFESIGSGGLFFRGAQLVPRR